MFSFLKKIPWWGWLGLGIGGYYLFIKKPTYTGTPSATEPALTSGIPSNSPLAKGLLPGAGGLYDYERTKLITELTMALERLGAKVQSVDVQGYGPKVSTWALTDKGTFTHTYDDNEAALVAIKGMTALGYW